MAAVRIIILLFFIISDSFYSGIPAVIHLLIKSILACDNFPPLGITRGSPAGFSILVLINEDCKEEKDMIAAHFYLNMITITF